MHLGLRVYLKWSLPPTWFDTPSDFLKLIITKESTKKETNDIADGPENDVQSGLRTLEGRPLCTKKPEIFPAADRMKLGCVLWFLENAICRSF